MKLWPKGMVGKWLVAKRVWVPASEGICSVLLNLGSIRTCVSACLEHEVGVVSNEGCVQGVFLCAVTYAFESVVCIPCLSRRAESFRKRHNVHSSRLTLVDLTDLVPRCQVSICLGFIAHSEFSFSPLPFRVPCAGAQQMEQCSCSRGCWQRGRLWLRWERRRIQSSTSKVNRVKPIVPLCICEIRNKRFSI